MTTLNDHLEHRGVTTATAILRQLNWRYATKRFDPNRKLAADELAALEKAAHLAPSSFGLQPWKFVVVSDPQIRQKLRAAAYGQAQIVDASHLVVFAARKGMHVGDVERHIGHIAKTHGVPAEALAEFKQTTAGFVASKPQEFIDAWAARQVYIPLGVLLATAALLGIDACPMEGFEPEKFNEILGLEKQGYSATVLCALGFRSADDHYASAPKVRFPAEEVFAHV